MRKFSLFLPLVLCGILSACDSNVPEPDNTPETVYTVEVSPNEVIIAPEGGEVTVTVTSSEQWTLGGGDSWSVPSTATGMNGDEITFKVEANETESERTLFYTMTCGTATAKLHFVQLPEDIIYVARQVYDIDKDGGEVEVDIEANGEFSYEIDEASQSWLTFVETRAMNSAAVIFSAEPNNTTEMREAIVTFSCGTHSEQVHICQSGVAPVITAIQKEYTVEVSGASITVNVTGNVEISVEIDASADWITYNPQDGAAGTYCFDIDRNIGSRRQATITFVNHQNNVSDTVTVSQQECSEDVFEVGDEWPGITTYNIGCEGLRIEIKVWANVVYHDDFTMYADWIHKEEVVQKGGMKTYIYNIDANAEDFMRVGVISFCKDDDTGTCFPVIIMQAGTAAN